MQKIIQILLLFVLIQFSFCAENYHLYCECTDTDVSSISTEKTYCTHWECDQKAHSASCFPGNAVVLSQNGSYIRMDNLEYNTKIMTVNHETGELIEDEVIGFLHKKPNQISEFLKLQVNNAEIDISEKHLILARKQSNSHSDYYFANKLQIGDEIFLKDNWKPIINISKFQQTGIYAPLTTTGTILVNNILVSCYANLENQFASQLAFLPYQYLEKVLKLFLSTSEQKVVTEYDVDGINWYANFLMKISKIMPISLNYEAQSQGNED